MRRKLAGYKIAAALMVVGVFAIPGSASQPDAEGPRTRLAAMQADIGFALDAHGATDFSIELPTGYWVADATL